MGGYELPVSVGVGGREYAVRTDYRCILDIFEIITDPEFTEEEKAREMMDIFYFEPSYEEIPPRDWQEAIDKCCQFINGGEQARAEKGPKVMDWQQDFQLIAAPVSRVYGKDIRAVPYDPKTNVGGLHWWTFLALYMEIGDCLFAQVVRIRDMKARGKRLDKQDVEFYQRNRNLIELKTRYTQAEEDFFREWGMS